MQIILLAIFCVACAEDVDMPEQMGERINYSDAELEKIAYGCNFYLDEDNDTKVETRASDEYLEYISEYVLRNTQTSLKAKPISIGNDTVYVGVIKRKTCGQYATILIHYDCEDRKNNTKYGDDIGAWEVVNKRENIDMYFCRVPFRDFPATRDGYGYALLRLSAKPLTFDNRDDEYTWILKIHMDAEDSHEETKLSLVDNHGKPIKGWETDKDYADVRNFVRVSNHGDLDIQLIYMGGWYAGEKNPGTFPDFGFEYSVFGDMSSGYNPKTGSKSPNANAEYRGWIYSDDEDDNNGNRIVLFRQDSRGNEEEIGELNELKKTDSNLASKIVEYSASGTKFYIKRVTPGNLYEDENGDL